MLVSGFFIMRILGAFPPVMGIEVEADCIGGDVVARLGEDELLTLSYVLDGSSLWKLLISACCYSCGS